MSKTQSVRGSENAEQPVWKTQGSKTVYHTNEDCNALNDASNVYERKLSELSDDHRECQRCSGTHDTDKVEENKKYGTNPLEVMLNAGMDPLEMDIDLEEYSHIPDELQERLDDEE